MTEKETQAAEDQDKQQEKQSSAKGQAKTQEPKAPTVEVPADAPYVSGLVADPLADQRSPQGQLPPQESERPAEGVQE